jgi:hypothetical protein
LKGLIVKTKTKWILIGLLILLSLVIVCGIKPLKQRYQRYVCGTNLRGLGKAMTVYANNYNDEYVVQDGQSPNGLLYPPDPNKIYFVTEDGEVMQGEGL